MAPIRFSSCSTGRPTTWQYWPREGGCRHITPIFNLVEPACSHMLVSLAHILQHLITHPSIAHAVAQAVPEKGAHSRNHFNMVAEHGCDMPWRAPQEQISERICEQIVDVQVPQDVEQAIEVLKISSQDRDLHGTVEQIPEDELPRNHLPRMFSLITNEGDRPRSDTVFLLTTNHAD